MSPSELDDALDAMQTAANGDAERLPGLIAVESGHWVDTLSAIGATCSALHDGLRHRNIQVHIGSGLKTRVLTRGEAGQRGAPYRELSDRG